MAVDTIRTGTELSEGEAKRRDALVSRLFSAFLGAADLIAIHIGDRLGLYRALHDEGPATSTQLAQRSGIAERYAREWLEQQAVTGVLEVDDARRDPSARVYRLPAAHAEPLLDRDSHNSIAPLARFLIPVGKVMPRLLEAYRTGGGVAWQAYGEDAWQAQGDFNRPLFKHDLVQKLLPQIQSIQRKLVGGARVADLACGVGWSSIAMAKGYANVRVDGYDTASRAVAAAREAAREAGVADRVTFHVREAKDARGTYDVVTIFESVHDFSRPVEILRTAHEITKEGGAVVVMDERVAETFTVPGDEVERLMYAFSIFVCLPNGLAERPSAATGTVMRPATLRAYAAAAGFRDVVIHAIEHPFFRFYELVK